MWIDEHEQEIWAGKIVLVILATIVVSYLISR